ncbi:MAG: hypothetical protein U0Q19_07330 [Kineosporiaceae bacterium]
MNQPADLDRSRAVPDGAPSTPRPVVTVPDERWLGLWPAGRRRSSWCSGPWSTLPGRPGTAVRRGAAYMGKASVMHRLEAVPSAQVVQLLSAGYEAVLPLLPPGVTLANAAGVHDTSTAELAWR